MKMLELSIPLLVIGSIWIFFPWKNSLKMLLARCACHRIADICNTFPVYCRAKFESIHIHYTCDSSQLNRHRHGCRTNRLHYNKPNGVVSSKSTKDLIAFSLQVSFPLPIEKFTSTDWDRVFFSFWFNRYSCDTHCNAAIYLRDRSATIARRCDNSVLSTYNERTNIECATFTHIENINSWIDFLHAISYMCHYWPGYNVLSQRFRLCMWRWVLKYR